MIIYDVCTKKMFDFICLTEVNECLLATHGGCEQGCVNKQGGHECFCGTGFILNADGKTCSGKAYHVHLINSSVYRIWRVVTTAIAHNCTNYLW